MEIKTDSEFFAFIRTAIEHELEKMSHAELRNTGWFTWDTDRYADSELEKAA